MHNSIEEFLGVKVSHSRLSSDSKIPSKVTRFEKIDRSHRIIELELDGICTHIETATDCPLKDSSFHRKLNDSRQAIRSARDIFRIDMGAKQWTLTTRGGTNRHGLWHLQVIRNWKCPYCHMNKKMCYQCLKPLTKEQDGYTCPKCNAFFCPKVFGEGYPFWTLEWDNESLDWVYFQIDKNDRIIKAAYKKEGKLYNIKHSAIGMVIYDWREVKRSTNTVKVF